MISQEQYSLYRNNNSKHLHQRVKYLLARVKKQARLLRNRDKLLKQAGKDLAYYKDKLHAAEASVKRLQTKLAYSGHA